MCVRADPVCVHMLAEHLAGPLANIRPEGGPSALEASCIPQPQQLTTHLSAFMLVSINSRPAAHLLYPPVIQAHRTLRPRGRGRGGGGKRAGRGLMLTEQNDSQRETNREVKSERQKARQMNPEEETTEGKRTAERDREELTSTFWCRAQSGCQLSLFKVWFGEKDTGMHKKAFNVPAGPVTHVLLYLTIPYHFLCKQQFIRLRLESNSRKMIHSYHNHVLSILYFICFFELLSAVTCLF